MAFFAQITQIRSCTVKFHGLHLGMVILVRNSRKIIPEMGCFNRPKCSFLLAGSGSMFSCSSLVKRQPEWSKSQFVIVDNCYGMRRSSHINVCIFHIHHIKIIPLNLSYLQFPWQVNLVFSQFFPDLLVGLPNINQCAVYKTDQQCLQQSVRSFSSRRPS